MYSEGLGRLYNFEQPASNRYISLREAAGVTFFGHEVDGATVFTLTFASDAAGTATATPAVIDHFYGKSFDVQAGVWHRTAQTASNVVNAADGTEDLVAIEVLASMAPVVNGVRYSWVKLAGDGSSTVTALLHDLAVGRAPQNLRSVTA